MTITQLEYIIAVDTYKSFLMAAEKCFVTQPTLSMQIKKLEEEFGVILFDRSKQPVIATEVGTEIIQQARNIVYEASKIPAIIRERSGEIQGKIRMGIIPTLAPYLLPLFLTKFLKKYPKVTIVAEELITDQLVAKLKNDQLDCGILVTPINAAGIQAEELFYEPFVVYTSKSGKLALKTTVTTDDIELQDMWILNEGHCMRNQINNLCFGNVQGQEQRKFEYQTGSIETLKKLVEFNGGFTIIPELSIADFSARQSNMVRYFKSPEPVREVSLVTHRNSINQRLMKALKAEIMSNIPAKMKNKSGRKLINIY